MGGKKHTAAGVKLAPPLQHALIVGERHHDHKTLFTVQVVPCPPDTRFAKRTATRHAYTVTRRYDDFVHFCQQLHDAFPPASTRSLASRAGPRLLSTSTSTAAALPRLNPKRLNLLHNKRQLQVQRRVDLDRFLDALFRLPPSISQSLPVLEFFGQQKEDTAEQVLRHQHQQHCTIGAGAPARLVRSHSSSVQQDGALGSAIRRSASHPDLVQNTDQLVHPLEMPSPSPIAQDESTSPLWRRFRNRAARPAAPPPPAPAPQPTTSSCSLTSLCNQAASMIMPWAGRSQHPPQLSQHLVQHTAARPVPSLSTPAPRPPPHPRRPRNKSAASPGCSHQNHHHHHHHFAPTPPLPIPQRAVVVPSSSTVSSTSTSSTSSHDSQSTCATSIAPSPSTSPTLRTIKFKIVYDVDNIIVIQVPRSVSLADLRERIMQKFSDPDVSLPADFTLLFNDTRSSASSSTSAASSLSVASGTATMIDKEDDLRTAMGSMWVRLDKVTLRCIA